MAPQSTSPSRSIPKPARALENPARRAAAGRYLSSLIKGRPRPQPHCGGDRRGQNKKRGPKAWLTRA